MPLKDSEKAIELALVGETQKTPSTQIILPLNNLDQVVNWALLMEKVTQHLVIEP